MKKSPISLFHGLTGDNMLYNTFRVYVNETTLIFPFPHKSFGVREVMRIFISRAKRVIGITGWSHIYTTEVNNVIL